MIIFILYVLLSSAGIILFKLGSTNMSIKIIESVLAVKISFLSILGLVCYLLSFVLWMYIIAKSEVHIIVPLGLALTNIAILVGSYFILGETFSTMSMIGATVIIIGVVIMNFA